VFDAAQAQRRFVIGMTDASHITLLPQSAGPGACPGAQAWCWWPVRFMVHLAQGLAKRPGRSGPGVFALARHRHLPADAVRPGLDLPGQRAPSPHRKTRRPDHWNLPVYQAEAHIGIQFGHRAATAGEARLRTSARHAPGAPGTAGLFGTCQRFCPSSDLLATLPRHIGETLARKPPVCAPCPALFTVRWLHRQTVLAHPVSPGPSLTLAARRVCRLVHEKCLQRILDQAFTLL
jgi:hypothetical protein